MNDDVDSDRAALADHGGNLAAAMRGFPQAPLPWIDLSTGINPVPYPADASAAAWSRLPDATSVRRLEAAAARAYGVVAEAAVVAAPGTQALLQWLPLLRPARRVGVLGQTYGEHERCWARAGADVQVVDDPAKLAEFDVAVVVNPNNPDGRLTALADLMALAGALADRGGTLVVDEAFMDVMPRNASLVPALPLGDTLVLRSFGKIFGLAGLRLGFAVASVARVQSLREALGPWCISGPAVEIGCAALADANWLDRTVSRLRQDARRLDGLLREAGFAIEGGTPLFRLASHADAAGWFDRLGRAGILVRPFGARPDWLRFGLPSDEAAWQRLSLVLQA